MKIDQFPDPFLKPELLERRKNVYSRAAARYSY